MIATIKNANSQLKSLNKAYTGGPMTDFITAPRSSGYVSKGGKSDRPGHTEGYAVIDPVTGQDTRMRLAGEEFIVNETESLQNEGFLKKFNGGAYRGLNLEIVTGKQGQ